MSESEDEDRDVVTVTKKGRGTKRRKGIRFWCHVVFWICMISPSDLKPNVLDSMKDIEGPQELSVFCKHF